MIFSESPCSRTRKEQIKKKKPIYSYILEASLNLYNGPLTRGSN